MRDSKMIDHCFAHHPSLVSPKVHAAMKTTDFKFLVDYARKAPSGHNTQPWKFEHSKDVIWIHPDFSRALPIVDPDYHALYISLGCALENLVIAATQKKYDTKVQYPVEPLGGIRIEFVKNNTIPEHDLFNFISERQVNRTKYSEKTIAQDKIQSLCSSFSFEGVSLLYLNGKVAFEKLIPLIIEGNTLQFENKQFIEELTSWFRYSRNEAEKTKDGLWTAVMGLPTMGKLIGNFVMRKIVSAKSESKRLKKILQHTQGLAIFSTDENNRTSWIKTGQAFQRFGLTATKLGISHAHLNMPCEEIKIRGQLAKELGIANKHPMLLIRCGYAHSMPYSYRRKIEDVILKMNK